MQKSITFALSILIVVSLATVSKASMTYSASGNGFGGLLGNGSMTVSDNGVDTLSFCFNFSGDVTFNNVITLYVDSVGGGFANTNNFFDNGDAIRAGISTFGTNGNNPADKTNLSFSGFTPDYAIGIDDNFLGSWALNNGTHTYIGNGGGAAAGSDYNNGIYKVDFQMSNFGISPGDTINFGATLLDRSNGYLSNESIGGLAGTTNGDGNYGNNNTTLGFVSYTVSAIPEPTSLALFGSCLAMLGMRRRFD